MNQHIQRCEKRNFIVNSDCLAKKAPLGSTSCKGNYNDGLITEKSLDQGTLLEEYITDRHERTCALHKSRQIIASNLDYPGGTSSYCAVDLNKLSNIMPEDAQLLLAVNPRERLKLMTGKNKDLLAEAKTIDVGSIVEINLPEYSGLGVVMCKGNYPNYGKGILFGIKFWKREEIRILQLTEIAKKYKDTIQLDECDVFVGIDKIRLRKCTYAGNTGLNFGSSKLHQPSSGNEAAYQASIKNALNDTSSINIGERIAWITDKGAEYGVVKWMGDLPGQSETIVGVELDNPVGSGTGLYYDRVLFTVKIKHAALIPISGLIREKDFKQPSFGQKFFKKKKKEKHSDVANLVLTQRPEHTYIVSLGNKSVKPKDPQLQRRESESAISQSQIHLVTEQQQQQTKQNVKQSEQLSEPLPQQHSIILTPQEVEELQHCELARNIVQKEEDPATPQSMHRSSQLILPDTCDSPIQIESIANDFPLKNNNSLESHKKASIENIITNGTLNGDTSKALKNLYDLNSKIPVTSHNQINDRCSSTYPISSQGRIKSPSSPTIPRRSSSTSNTDTNATRLSNNDKQILPIENIEFTQERSYASVLSNKQRNRKPSITDPLVPSRVEKKLNYPKQDFSSSTELSFQNDTNNFFVEKQIHGSNDFLSNKEEFGSSNSLPKNGFITASTQPTSPFEQHDFLYGTTEGNLDVLESFTFNDTRFHETNGFNAHVTDKVSCFEVGSVVEVIISQTPCYGVIRWIGSIPHAERKVAGLEMEDELPNNNCDGTFDSKKYFSCPPGKGFFIYLDSCRQDRRFLESLQPFMRDGINDAVFGSIDCPTITGDVSPLTYCEKLLNQIGKNKGIQGHHNSCYLDATLFSMFTFTSVFDSILHRPPMTSDIKRYEDVQKVLKEDIVNPLRKNLYVRADRVMKLRTLLEDLGSVSGLTCEEKDPEEFLNSLLHQILKAEPFLKFSSGQEAYFYQLFVEKNENLQIPTVQQLFDQSFLTSDIKLKEIPSCLIIQMPRFGKQFKTYDRIFPTLVLDITDVLEDSPRECCVCGLVAEYECRDCFCHFEPMFTMKAFCNKCISRIHNHKVRAGHNPRKIAIPDEFGYMLGSAAFPRIHMDLFAIVCIETSHYVAFVKCGNQAKSPWCFFDSMADRKGEQNGYNIPEVSLCQEVSDWLSDECYNAMLAEHDIHLPELAKRLFGDAYMCMYQSSSVMMYQ